MQSSVPTAGAHWRDCSPGLPKKDEPDKQLPMKRHPRVFKRRVGYHPKTLGSASALVIHEDTTRAPLCRALGQSRKPPSLPHDTRCCGTPPTLALTDPNSCTTTTRPRWVLRGRQILALTPFPEVKSAAGRQNPLHHPPPPHPPSSSSTPDLQATDCRNSARSRRVRVQRGVETGRRTRRGRRRGDGAWIGNLCFRVVSFCL
jgi:hypothetical protein